MGMTQEYINNKTLKEWQSSFPLLNSLMAYEPIFWMNSEKKTVRSHLPVLPLSEEDIMDAERRWHRFAPLIQSLFPETEGSQGIIESPLKEIPKMKLSLEEENGMSISGRLFLKCDNELPVAGSIKARGGIYEVLKHAETLAMEHGMLSHEDNYAIMASERFRRFFQQYGIAVGSTGNLGLSIGIISAAIGFRVTVHMSADAKAWKKDLLRTKGVQVIEYASDYSKAVEEGRKQSDQDPMSYFVDDEQSKELFLGYSVAAYRVKKQLEENGVTIDKENPLVLYLPCGVGGAPGGVAFGAKILFGEDVYCIFAEPTHSPCMLLGLMTGLHEKAKVQDFQIDNMTEADGLAVGSPSALVSMIVGPWIDGVYTVGDSELYPILAGLKDLEGIKIEPSSGAALLGFKRFKENHSALERIPMKNAIHIAWATGGLFVPDDQMEAFYRKGIEKQ
ncbi:MAG: D-serine ammonia-lyase [Anaerosolibacter sp.]|jgi:D-serine dehydratase|uniref:D-serine ammonia-lyase n=1 Tax=Anaerosolibacter sp. TaxID=1872527 RepID=UPI002A39E9D2|nr:D-serine ammonia-lyase [Anaerosolibacter sp.]